MWFITHRIPHSRIVWYRYRLRMCVLWWWLACFVVLIFGLIKVDRPHITIYIDGSLSMMTPDIWTDTRFETAQQMTTSLATQIDDAYYSLYLVGRLPVPIVHWVEWSVLHWVIAKLDPHRLTLVSGFVGSVLDHLRSYHRIHHPDSAIVVFTDGYQTTWSYLSVSNLSSTIVGIWSSGFLLWYDRFGRPVYTVLDQEGLTLLAQKTHSNLVFVNRQEDIDAVSHKIIKSFGGESWISYLIVIWFFLTFLIVWMFVTSIVQIYLYYHRRFDSFKLS